MKTASPQPSSTWMPVEIAETQVIHLVSPRTAPLVRRESKDFLIFLMFLFVMVIAIFATQVL
jgi:hypothetical protein